MSRRAGVVTPPKGEETDVEEAIVIEQPESMKPAGSEAPNADPDASPAAPARTADAVIPCGDCGWEFKPLYTSGECPLCHWKAPDLGPVDLGLFDRMGVWMKTGANGLLVGFAALAAAFSILFLVVFLTYLNK